MLVDSRYPNSPTIPVRFLLLVAVLGSAVWADRCTAQSPPPSPTADSTDRLHQHPERPTESLEQILKREPIEQLARDVMQLGDPVRGSRIYFHSRLNCIVCHEPGERNRRFGPDLTVQRAVDTKFLIRSLLDPSRDIHREYQPVIVETIDGRIWTGVLVLNGATRLILDPVRQPAELMVIDKDSIEQWRIGQVSSMPEHLVDGLADRGQFLDLIRYLQTIADEGPARAAALRPADKSPPAADKGHAPDLPDPPTTEHSPRLGFQLSSICFWIASGKAKVASSMSLLNLTESMFNVISPWGVAITCLKGIEIPSTTVKSDG